MSLETQGKKLGSREWNPGGSKFEVSGEMVYGGVTVEIDLGKTSFVSSLKWRGSFERAFPTPRKVQT